MKIYIFLLSLMTSSMAFCQVSEKEMQMGCDKGGTACALVILENRDNYTMGDSPAMKEDLLRSIREDINSLEKKAELLLGKPTAYQPQEAGFRCNKNATEKSFYDLTWTYDFRTPAAKITKSKNLMTIQAYIKYLESQIESNPEKEQQAQLMCDSRYRF
jgi:hypothetical protein